MLPWNQKRIRHYCNSQLKLPPSDWKASDLWTWYVGTTTFESGVTLSTEAGFVGHECRKDECVMNEISGKLYDTMQSVQELSDNIFISCVRSCLGRCQVNKKSCWHKIVSRYVKVISQWLITKF